MLIITASSLRQVYRLLKVITQLLLDSYENNTNKQQLPLPQPSQATYWSTVKKKTKTKKQEKKEENAPYLTLSSALTFAPRSNNSFTTDSCPYQQARWRGVKENYQKRKKKTQLDKVERVAK